MSAARNTSIATGSGCIEIITGCMFSGKTEELLRRLRRAEIAEQDIKVFKPALDDRYSEKEIGTHNGEKWEAEVVDVETESLEEKFLSTEADVVAVDEANFFQENLVEAVEAAADSGARVIATGIDQNFRGQPFNPLPELMASAEYVDKLRAICTVCGGEATRTQRLIDGEPAHVDEPTILVGADESYEARCRMCHEVKRD